MEERPGSKTIRFRIQTPRSMIALIAHIIEGYDGLAQARTECAATGVMAIEIPGSREDEFRSLLKDLSGEFLIRELPLEGEPAEFPFPDAWPPRRCSGTSSRTRRKRKRRRLLR